MKTQETEYTKLMRRYDSISQEIDKYKADVKSYSINVDAYCETTRLKIAGEKVGTVEIFEN